MNALHKFWFQFEASPKPNVLNLGCGVTALSYEDALCVLKERIFAQKNFPNIVGFFQTWGTLNSMVFGLRLAIDLDE